MEVPIATVWGKSCCVRLTYLSQNPVYLTELQERHSSSPYCFFLLASANDVGVIGGDQLSCRVLYLCVSFFDFDYLSVCFCVCVPLCIFLSLCVSFVFLSLDLHHYLFISLCVSVSAPVSVSLCAILPSCLPSFLTLCLSVLVSPFSFWSLYLPIFLSRSLFLSLSLCPNSVCSVFLFVSFLEFVLLHTAPFFSVGLVEDQGVLQCFFSVDEEDHPPPPWWGQSLSRPSLRLWDPASLRNSHCVGQLATELWGSLPAFLV